MPYFLDQENVGSNLASLQSFAPTDAEAFGAQVGEAWESNPTVLGFDAFQFARANRKGERLTAYDAGKVAKEAGVSDFAPEGGGYTREALDMVLERKRTQRQRQDVIANTPYSWTGTPLRGLGVLGTTLLDPLNIGSAFVPVVGEARYAALLGQAGGAAGRAAVRAGVGAAEGAVGTALLEPLVAGGRAYLGDDYSMHDSLLNIAFGGFTGGGLHVVGGAVADVLKPGRWDAVRSLDAAAEQADIPAPRRDTGEPTPGSAAETVLRAGPEARADGLRVSVAHLAEGKTVEAAPLFDDHAARAIAGEAEARRVEARGYDPHATSMPNADPLESLFNELGWAERGGQLLRREEVDERGIPIQGGGEVIGRTKWAAKSEFWPDRPDKISEKQAIAALEKAQRGEPLGVREQRFVDYAREVLAGRRTGDIALAHKTEAERLEAKRERDAIRAESGLLDEEWASTHLAELDAHRAEYDAGMVAAMRAAAERHAGNESSITADYFAALAAEERLAAAPKREDVAAAQKMADEAIARAKRGRDGLEASGASAKQLKAFDDAMAEADAMVSDGKALGRAAEAAAECGVARA